MNPTCFREEGFLLPNIPPPTANCFGSDKSDPYTSRRPCHTMLIILRIGNHSHSPSCSSGLSIFLRGYFSRCRSSFLCFALRSTGSPTRPLCFTTLIILRVSTLTSRRSPHFVRQAGCSPARSRPYGTQSGLLTSRNPTLPIVALTRATSVPDARVCSLFLASSSCIELSLYASVNGLTGSPFVQYGAHYSSHLHRSIRVLLSGWNN
jgi:hypothetical protein